MVCIRVECGHFFDRSEQVNYPKVRYDFRSPNPNFGRAPEHTSQSFNFQKIPGGPNINIFDENWHAASFYIKEQTQIYKFEISLLKSTILNPKKCVFCF